MKLVIGNKNYSSWSMRPWLLLRHFDIEFDEVRIPLFVEGYAQRLAEFSASMKVPVLIDPALATQNSQEQSLWDSLAICEYVSEKYLQGRGWPESPIHRAKARAYCSEMHSGFFALREQMPMNCRARRQITVGDDLSKDIQRIDDLWRLARQEYATKGQFLFGKYSIADCMFAPVVMRLNTYTGSDMPELSDASKDYIQTISETEEVVQWCADAAAESETIAAGEKGDPI